MKYRRFHEWAKHCVGKRTVCGLTGPKLKPAQVVHNLGDHAAVERCASCERMRDASGTSSTRGG